MKISVTGFEGSVGRSLVNRGCFPFVCDITKFDKVRDTVLQEHPDLIIHCAAITDIDYCEIKEHSEEVIKTNFSATANLIECAGDTPVIFISSDHVFDGKRGGYSEKDLPHPINFYGLSKATAESSCMAYDNAYIVRTSALFKESYKDLGRYESALMKGKEITVPTVLYRTFLHVEHFVEGLVHYASKAYRKENLPKILHISGRENISWYELAICMAERGKYDTRLVHPRARKDDNYVPRPLNAGLNTDLSRRLGIPSYSYLDGLELIYGR